MTEIFIGSRSNEQVFSRQNITGLQAEKIYTSRAVLSLDDTAFSFRFKKLSTIPQTKITVAFTALDFTNQFPHVEIFAEGSTSARTRLYQIEIGNNLMEINRFFKIEGFVNGEWELFLPGKNYEAFLIYRK